MAENNEALIVFTPSGKRGHFPKGTTILDAARNLGVDLDSVCGGHGLCGRCQVVQSVGSFPKHGIESEQEHLSEFTDTEEDYADIYGIESDRRLGCAAQILGDLVIDVPADSQVHKQVVRKRAEVHDIEVNPLIRLHYVEVREPDMHDPSGDLQRLKEALKEQWQLESLEIDYYLLAQLQGILRKEKWAVTVAVYDAKRIIAIWPGFKDTVYGMAVDVGSTTIAAHMCSFYDGEVLGSAGLMNPQIKFGEDLMSRVSYVMMNPGGDKQMTSAVRESLQELAASVCKEAGIELTDIVEVTLVGNPIMHHLMLGIDPTELGGAPFALATDEAITVNANELDLSLNPGARAFVLPCIAGHVGADTAGVVLSEAPYLRDEITLVVDVGTNAEIVLGNNQRMLAASSPTGPAFEGAQISCGQRAAPGAIERVRINPQTLEPKFRVIGCELWSDEQGFEEQVKDVGITGICGSGIIEIIAEMFLAGIISSDGVIDGSLAAKTPRVIEDGRTFSYVIHDGDVKLKIIQNDVRAIQLAKAALYAGVRLLMDHMQIETVDRIRLAGAFGSHIDVKYATILGLIPDCDLEYVTSAGNAAGTGARIALLDKNARGEISKVVKQIEKIETAVEAKFQDHFVEAMAFPHKTASYPNLSKVVELPVPRFLSKSSESEGGESKRRRRRR